MMTQGSNMAWIDICKTMPWIKEEVSIYGCICKNSKISISMFPSRKAMFAFSVARKIENVLKLACKISDCAESAEFHFAARALCMQKIRIQR